MWQTNRLSDQCNIGSELLFSWKNDFEIESYFLNYEAVVSSKGILYTNLGIKNCKGNLKYKKNISSVSDRPVVSGYGLSLVFCTLVQKLYCTSAQSLSTLRFVILTTNH